MVGRESAKLHEITKNFKLNRKNDCQLNLGEKFLTKLKIDVIKFIQIFLD
jgi:hypothetical protein